MTTPDPLTVSDQPNGRHTDGLWEVAEVAEYLKCTPRTVWRRIKNDGLPFKRVGRRVLFRPAEIDAWIESQNKPTEGVA